MLMLKSYCILHFKQLYDLVWIANLRGWLSNYINILIIETQYDKMHCPRKPVCVNFHHDRFKSKLLIDSNHSGVPTIEIGGKCSHVM